MRCGGARRWGTAGWTLIAVLVVPAAGTAADFYVNTTIDEVDGSCLGGIFDCSLRDAVIAANRNPGPDTIHVPAGTYNLTIPDDPQLPSDETGSLFIEDDVDIEGAGASLTVINGLPTDEVFLVPNGRRLQLFDLTVSGGGEGIRSVAADVTLWRCTVRDNARTSPALGVGGGLSVNGGTTLIFDSLIRDNADVSAGGGIHVSSGGLLMVIRSTLTRNIAGDEGGAVSCEGSPDVPTLWFINSTVTGNEVLGADTAGGVFGRNCDVILDSSTFAGNVRNDLELLPGDPGTVTVRNSYIGSQCPAGTASAVTSEGGNVGTAQCGLSHPSDIDQAAGTAILLPLGDYGGHTPTMPPFGVGFNPLVDNPGADANCALEDQRLVARPQDGGSGTLHCDTGAVERTLADLAFIFADDFESGNTSAWSESAP